MQTDHNSNITVKPTANTVIILSIWNRQALADSADPGQTSHDAVSDQGLHCLQLNLAVLVMKKITCSFVGQKW